MSEKPSVLLKKNRAAIIAIINQYSVKNPRVFGSILKGNDRIGSDLDLLVEPTQRTSLFDIGGIKNELEKLLHIPVDVLTPNSLPSKFRNQILMEAKPL